MKTDIVIPLHSKDLPVIPWCIEGIKNFIPHNTLYVISDLKNKKAVEVMGGTFLDENTIVPGLTRTTYRGKRWGWYFQQFIKYGMCEHVQTDYYLVIDSDTVFLRNVTFFNEHNKPLYNPTTEHTPDYFDKFFQLFGVQADYEYSFIAHHMVFSKQIMREMLEELSTEMRWYENIMQGIDPSNETQSQSLFADYETYGHYLKLRHPEEVNLRKLTLGNASLKPCKNLLIYFSQQYDYCCFHHYGIHGKLPDLSSWLYKIKMEFKLFLLCKFNIKTTFPNYRAPQ